MIEKEEQNRRCTEELGYSIEAGFFAHVEIEGESYFDIVREAIKGDTCSIRRLTIAQVHAGEFNRNATILIDIIDRIGEKKYIEIIENFTPNMKSYTYDVLASGVDFSRTKPFPKYYPLLYQELKDYEH